MKRYFILFLWICSFTLIACSPISPGDPQNEITQQWEGQVKTVESSKEIVDGRYIFSFEITPPERINRMDVWVDIYKKGNKVNQIDGGGYTLSPDKTAMLITMDRNNENSEENWKFYGLTNQSRVAIITWPEREESKFLGTFQPKTSLKEIPAEGGELLLGEIVVWSQKGGNAADMPEAMSDLENNLENDFEKTIAVFDMVYLLKGRFSFDESFYASP